MKLNKGKKIIYEDDIILSDGSTTLSERFSSNEADISKLKSNVKWLYKYGGVGSSGGGGTGSSSTEFSIYATLNNVQLSGQTITLPSTGNYTLLISINKPGGLSYRVRYTNNNRTSAAITLNADNSWATTVSLNLTTNSTLTVEVTNEDNEKKQVTCDYITTPYTITTQLKSNSNSVWTNLINISEAISQGLDVVTSYGIYVPTLSTSYQIKFNDEIVVDTTEINNTSGEIRYTIPQELLTDENAGYYSGLVIFNIITSGLSVQEVRDFSMLLIPESLYLLFYPASSGLIYSNLVDEPYNFKQGSNSFNYVVYDGSSTSSNYTINFTINNNEQGIRTYTSVQALREQSIDLFSQQSGWNRIDVLLTNTLNNNTYSKTYYYYVGDSDVSIDWPDTSIWTQYYYRAGDVTSQFSQFNGEPYFAVNSLDDTITITGILCTNTATTYKISTHIAIGLLLSSVNDSDTPLFSFVDNNGSTLLTVTTNQLQQTSAIKSTLSLKKEQSTTPGDMSKYHLIDIFSTYMKTQSSTPYCEISGYIDGVLESSLPSLIGGYLNVYQLVIHPFNGYINLIDVEYRNGDGEVSDTDYDVYKYYLKYANTFLLDSTVSDQLIIAEAIENGFKYDSSTGRILTDTATADTIATASTIPTLLFEIDAASLSIEDVLQTLEKQYGESSSDNFSYSVNVRWHPGNNSNLLLLSISNIPESARFLISGQGSSTKGYRVKNYELELVSSDSNTKHLFSPNFNQDDASTFLPEESFTLKADVVDSSHSNNTACGKFVNTVTLKFVNGTSTYSKFIKNCLDGFPILVYVLIYKYDNVGNLTSQCYYMGVYNFNLGRNSYYNLGYKSLTPLEEIGVTNAESGFSFTSINESASKLLPGLGVAEVQGNSGYFDFSQYDSSILYQIDDSDSTYMYDDFVYGSNKNSLQTALTAVTKQISKAGGYIFDYLKKNFGSPEDGYKKERSYNGSTQSANQVPDYRILYTRTLQAGKSVYTAQDSVANSQSLDLVSLLAYDEDSGVRNYIDYLSLSEYYTICMVLGLVDSVLKNLNLKTWTLDPDNASNPATWFTAFYDMDTCLGVDNSGGDINPLAFSDYWTTEYETISGDSDHIIPKTSNVYGDYGPSSLGNSGYDTPSSYLFAVAKYARLFMNSSESNGDVTAWFPQELYAKWRSSLVNTSTNQGILINADSFVDEFFVNNLGLINKALVSYNYRSKYFKLTGTSWVQRDYQKFKGTRVNKVREWFSNRLHLLDLYFGLNTRTNTPILYCEEDSEYLDLIINGNTIYYPTYVGSSYALDNNTDVIVLQDILLSAGSGLLLVTSDTFYIQCPDYTPTLISTANSTQGSYILNSNIWNQLSIKTEGNQYLYLGGSKLWSDASKLNGLLQRTTTGSGGSEFNLYSDNLKRIVVTLYNSDNTIPTCTEVNFQTPAVEEIILNSSGIAGTLTYSELSACPNLSNIDISGTKLNLNIQNINVRSVNLSNIYNTGGSITILNCAKLSNLLMDNLTVNSLTLSNINISTYDLSSSKIPKVSLESSLDNSSIVIDNNTYLESLTLSGFSSITITNCSNLKNLIIVGNPSYIQIGRPNSELAVISNSSDSYKSGVIDLSNITSSPEIVINNTGATTISLPAGAQLNTRALANNSALLYLNGSNIAIYGTSVFNQCPQFTGLDSDGNISDIYFYGTDLSNMFYCTSQGSGAITLETAVSLINDHVQHKDSVTTLSLMFCGQHSIECAYSTRSNFNIAWSEFTVLESVSRMFYNTAIVYLSASMLSGIKGDVDFTLFASSTVDGSTATQLRVEQDLLTVVDSDNETWPIGGNPSISHIFTISGISQYTGNDGLGISIKDFLCPNDKTWSRTSLNNISFAGSRTYDFTGLFDHFENLEEIVNFGNGVSLFGTIKATIPEYMFKLCTKLKTFSNSFKTYISFNSDRVDLINQFYWENNPSIDGGVNVYVTYNDINNLITTTLKDSTSLNNLLKNTWVIKSDTTSPFILGDVDSPVELNITSVESLFEGCEIHTDTTSGSTNFGIVLSQDTFKYLPKVVNFRNCFKNIVLASQIPLNLFGRRKESIEQVTINSVQGTLHSYSYDTSLAITNLYGLFDSATFVDTYRAEYNHYKPSDSSKSYIEDVNGNVFYEGSYLDSNGTLQTLSQGTEITDSENVEGPTISSITDGSYTLNRNYSYYTQGNELCIPPDLFYCISSSCDVRYALHLNSRISGIIPEHIFTRTKTSLLNNLFLDLYIVPRKVGSNIIYKDTHYAGDIDITINVYQYFPDDYTVNQSLNEVFNCSLLLPSLDDEMFIVISDKTVSTSIANTFTGAFLIQSGAPLVNTLSGKYMLNPVGSINDGEITLGFDLTKFRALNVEKLLTTDYLVYFFGRIFTKGTTVSVTTSIANTNGLSDYVNGKVVNNNTKNYNWYVLDINNYTADSTNSNLLYVNRTATDFLNNYIILPKGTPVKGFAGPYNNPININTVKIAED